MMKNYFLLLLFSWLLFSCKDNENIIGQFTIDVPYSIGILTPLKTHYFINRSIGIEFEKFLESKGITAAQVTRVEPASAVLSNVSNNQRWGIISESTVFIFNVDDEKEEYRSYELNLVPTNTGEQLSMIPYILDLQKLFYAPRLGIKLRMTARSSNAQTIEAILRLRFNVLVE